MAAPPALSPQQLLAAGRYVEAGRALEASLRLAEAIQAYSRGAAWAEVARIHYHHHQFEAAADAWMRMMPAGWTPARQPPQPLHGAVYQAAMCYQQVGRIDDAVALLGSLGRQQQAAELLRSQGRHAEAAEVLGGGRPASFASDDPVTQAVALAQGGQTRQALSMLYRIAPGQPAYPRAARAAVAIARQQGVLDFDLDHFVGAWAAGRLAAHEPADCAYLVALAELYEHQGFAESAAGAYLAAAALSPENPALAAKVQALRRSSVKDRSGLGRILEQDLAFHGEAPRRRAASPLPDLPDLPDLPELTGEAPLPSPRPAPVDESADESADHTFDVDPAETMELPARIDPNLLDVGDVVADRYEIEALLGQGGMGKVFRVSDRLLDEQVAMKLFLADDDPAELQRFKSEMKICRKLNHDNVVRTFEFGTWKGSYFLTMEVLAGADLHDYLKDLGGPMPLEQGLGLMIQACDGLEAAHKLGIVHRDIKPQNLFVMTGGKALKVMDFGIAKAVSSDTGVTRAGTLVGSPAYMAPERLMAEGQQSASADIYALGVVLYQVFTGRLPFNAREIPALFMQHVSEPPPSPQKLNPGIPQALDTVMVRCLAKKPEDRYENCKALRRALQEVWRGLL